MAGHDFDSGSPRWGGLFWSLNLGELAGIRIRIHLSLVVLIIALLLFGIGNDISFAIALVVCLFVIVLGHEFGHCFGCRAVNGEADEILLWPLGGLAFVRPPHRPWESMVTTAAGPAVNLAACILLFPVLLYLGVPIGTLLNPADFGGPLGSVAVMWLTVFYNINYMLLLFNLLPIFPLDGGRLLQQVLWAKLDYPRATILTTTVGMVGAVCLAGFGLFMAGKSSIFYLMLTALGVSAGLECYRIRRDFEMMGEFPENNEFGYDFSQGYTSLERSMPGRATRMPSLRERLRTWFRKRKERQALLLDAELDRILAKISERGIDSLSWTERKTLKHASKMRQGQRSEPERSRSPDVQN